MASIGKEVLVFAQEKELYDYLFSAANALPADSTDLKALAVAFAALGRLTKSLGSCQYECTKEGLKVTVTSLMPLVSEYFRDFFTDKLWACKKTEEEEKDYEMVEEDGDYEFVDQKAS